MSLDCERPESYLGMLMALEGVSDGFTIIHGPTGCKYYPASVSETAFPDRGGEVKARNLFRYSCKYFFSQPRLPCTYLDMGRFVTGATELNEQNYAQYVSEIEGMRLQEALDAVQSAYDRYLENIE